MSIPVLPALTLAGGSTFSGINFAITSQNLVTHGLVFSLKKDTGRQTILNFILFILSIAAIIAYPINPIGQPAQVSNLMTIIIFVSNQYGLVIINHNTIERLHFTYPNSRLLKLLSQYYIALYLIPFFTLIPVYLCIAEAVPKNLFLNKSSYNAVYFKPINIAFIFTTEALAVITDFKLLGRIFYELNMAKSDQTKMKNSETARQMLFEYIIIWLLLLFDVILKVIIASGISILFDSAVTATTLVMRVKCNLTYGIFLKKIIQNQMQSTSLVQQSIPAGPTCTPDEINVEKR
ncbi:hypothetical protein BC833DRAFT_619764 [Globomyces pollinis-pini]|nr:hypothetical protein BC833DRAFT_619764 [Globomyces pollinis-pini]